ncbi:MAG TPA: hypothetical protein VJZ77_02170, partial [Blastocatellia bacterium]|nr:hypothetical protein [Blastocatellia bacterium]
LRAAAQSAETAGRQKLKRRGAPGPAMNLNAGLVTVVDVNGAVDMAFAPGAARSIKVGGVNGDVGLRFDGDVNADLVMWGIAGAIKPDLQNVEIRHDEPVWNVSKARIASGGSEIEINDVSGNVTLSNASSGDASALKVRAK